MCVIALDGGGAEFFCHVGTIGEGRLWAYRLWIHAREGEEVARGLDGMEWMGGLLIHNGERGRERQGRQHGILVNSRGKGGAGDSSGGDGGDLR